MTRVLVTGVRGKTGVPLAELLVGRQGVEVLGGGGSPSTVTIDGVRPTAFSWGEPSGWAVTDTVERITGRPARTLQAFLADTGPAPDLAS